MVNYHPSDELLMQFAAGQLSNALGIMVACHLESCHKCRQITHLYEQVGGELLDSSGDISVSADLLTQTLAKLGETEKSDLNTMPVSDFPRPIRRFVPATTADIPWRGFSKSIQEFVLPFSDHNLTAKFYKIAAGKELPEHTHKGHEYTLVMGGSFSDLSGSYHQGDFILADTSTIHQPRAHEDGDCICFAVLDAPLKMTGVFGKLLNPFLR